MIRPNSEGYKSVYGNTAQRLTVQYQLLVDLGLAVVYLDLEVLKLHHLQKSR